MSRYLYEELQAAYLDCNSEIFTHPAPHTAHRCCLKPGVKFHFFTSHTPCKRPTYTLTSQYYHTTFLWTSDNDGDRFITDAVIPLVLSQSQGHFTAASFEAYNCDETASRGWWWLFPRLQGFGGNVRSFIPCLHFFFFEVEISLRTLIPLFMTGSVHSGWASWDDCGRMFHDKLRVSSFPDGFPHYSWTAA